MFFDKIILNVKIFKVHFSLSLNGGTRVKILSWQRLGQYEYQHDGSNYTGWYRCIGGRLENGHWPQWNNKTGATR